MEKNPHDILVTGSLFRELVNPDYSYKQWIVVTDLVCFYQVMTRNYCSVFTFEFICVSTCPVFRLTAVTAEDMLDKLASLLGVPASTFSDVK